MAFSYSNNYRFFSRDTVGGMLLILTTILAFIVANSYLASDYSNLLNKKLSINFGNLGLEKPVILWINDGLMAVFFFLVGLELKREILEGKLRKFNDVLLPGVAAIAGMTFPGLIFLALNHGNPESLQGWAIPVATDIAFALGILALMHRKVPASLKVFLLTLAILDDIGAIVIIALFYSQTIELNYLLLALIPIVGMFILHQTRFHRVGPTLFLSVILWFLILKSGVHATLAGVVAALFIPIKDKRKGSPLHRLEYSLSPYVFFIIVPTFAFVNAGIDFSDMSFSTILKPLPLGIALGLLLGNQIGVMSVVWILVKLKYSKLPVGTNWRHIYGASCLAGIGLTMSLFIGSLSLGETDLLNEVRLGVFSGSFLSAVMGCITLYNGVTIKSEFNQ